jgi:hypothetical protein
MHPRSERLFPAFSCDRADPHRLLPQPIISLIMSVSARTSSEDVIRYLEHWLGSTVIILVHSAIYSSKIDGTLYVTWKHLVLKCVRYLKGPPAVACDQWTRQDDVQGAMH